MIQKKKILITGPMPPPAGGISIHLARLKYQLQPHFDMDILDESPTFKKDYFNIRSLNLFQYISKIYKNDLIYIHSGNRFFKKLNIFTALLFQKKIIVTIHGYGKKRNLLLRWWDQLFFNRANKIVLVNHEIHKKINLNPTKCVVQHAFLPPIMEQEPSLTDTIQSAINNARKEGKIIICANASRLDTYNGEDLYGLDIALEAVYTLKNENKPYLLIFNVSSLDNGLEKFEKAQHFIKKHNLSDTCIVISEKISFVKLIEQADIVIRPTNTDGDALTIREALYLNKQVIASDVVVRPEGTILFKTRNASDLAKKIDETTQKTTIEMLNNKSTDEDPIVFYKNLIASTLNKKQMNS